MDAEVRNDDWIEVNIMYNALFLPKWKQLKIADSQ